MADDYLTTKEACKFIIRLNNNIQKLKPILDAVSRQEELLEENIFVKKGFLLHRYSLRFDKITPDVLDELSSGLKKTKEAEDWIEHESKITENQMIRFEKDYMKYYPEKFPLKLVLTEYMKNAFYLSRLANVRVAELKKIFEESTKAEINEKGGKAHHLLKSLGKMTNQIMKFLEMMWQLAEKANKFSESKTYDTARRYGRAVNKQEYKETIKMKRLSSPKNPTPVFDAPISVITDIRKKNEDEIKNFFMKIGIKGVYDIVYFETDLKPVVGPVPQTNGLHEFKFPKGISIHILETV